MVRPQGLRIDFQRTLEERFGLGVLALSPVESCECMESSSSARMVGAKRLLTHGEGTLGERFGFGIAALDMVESYQVNEPAGDIRVAGAKPLLVNGEGEL